MSARIQVLHNGERVCVSGIRGDGVLAITLDYVKHADKQGEYRLHVGGLGRYHPALEQDQHVHWPVPAVDVGDEITIRILPAGEFDEPYDIRQDPAATVDDPLFGRIEYRIDAWDATVPVEFPPIKSAHVHIVAPDSGPLESQRRLFQEFVARHSEVWPQMADALVRCHSEITSVNELDDRIDPAISVNIYDDSNTLEISLTVAGDPDNRGYFMTIRDWEIVEVCSTD